MAAEQPDRLAFTARELDQLAADLARFAARVHAAGEALGGSPARACAEWASVLRADLTALTELAVDTGHAARTSESDQWSPWSPPVRPGAGPRLAGTDGDRAGPELGVRVAQLPSE